MRRKAAAAVRGAPPARGLRSAARVGRTPADGCKEPFQRRWGRHFWFVVRGRMLPRRLPGRKQIVKGAPIGLPARPAHLQVAHRWPVEVGGVPVAGQPPPEQPAPVDAFVVVPIEHLHDDPLGAGLMLVLRVQQPQSVVRVRKLSTCSSSMASAPSRGRAQRFIGHRAQPPTSSLDCYIPLAIEWPVYLNGKDSSCATPRVSTSTWIRVRHSTNSSVPPSITVSPSDPMPARRR